MTVIGFLFLAQALLGEIDEPVAQTLAPLIANWWVVPFLFLTLGFPSGRLTRAARPAPRRRLRLHRGRAAARLAVLPAVPRGHRERAADQLPTRRPRTRSTRSSAAPARRWGCSPPRSGSRASPAPPRRCGGCCSRCSPDRSRRSCSPCRASTACSPASSCARARRSPRSCSSPCRWRSSSASCARTSRGRGWPTSSWRCSGRGIPSRCVRSWPARSGIRRSSSSTGCRGSSATSTPAASRSPCRAGAPGRAATPVEHDGEQVAVLVHDAALNHEPELLEVVCAAADVALERERLHAELESRVAGARRIARPAGRGRRRRAAADRARPPRRRAAAARVAGDRAPPHAGPHPGRSRGGRRAGDRRAQGGGRVAQGAARARPRHPPGGARARAGGGPAVAGHTVADAR